MEKGEKKGKEKGLKEGSESTKKNIATTLLKKGMSSEEIEEITGITIQEIEKIRSNLAMP